MCADLPAAGMRAKRRKLGAQAVALQAEVVLADPSEAQAVALQPEVVLADPSEAQAVALQPEVDLAVQEQNKPSRVQKESCLL